jgi:hypothetical protein
VREREREKEERKRGEGEVEEREGKEVCQMLLTVSYKRLKVNKQYATLIDFTLILLVGEEDRRRGTYDEMERSPSC